MSNNDGGAVTGQVGQCLADASLGARIDGGGGVIEYDYARMRQYTSRDGESLTLTT